MVSTVGLLSMVNLMVCCNIWFSFFLPLSFVFYVTRQLIAHVLLVLASYETDRDVMDELDPPTTDWWLLGVISLRATSRSSSIFSHLNFYFLCASSNSIHIEWQTFAHTSSGHGVFLVTRLTAIMETTRLVHNVCIVSYFE